MAHEVWVSNLKSYRNIFKVPKSFAINGCRTASQLIYVLFNIKELKLLAGFAQPWLQQKAIHTGFKHVVILGATFLRWQCERPMLAEVHFSRKKIDHEQKGSRSARSLKPLSDFKTVLVIAALCNIWIVVPTTKGSFLLALCVTTVIIVRGKGYSNSWDILRGFHDLRWKQYQPKLPSNSNIHYNSQDVEHAD